MPEFSKSSKEKLATCHQDLQTLFNYVIRHFDCTVVCGTRNEADQNKAFDGGFSQVRFPNSKHNASPSMAIDVVPYPVEWQNVKRMRHFVGYVLGCAQVLKDYNAIEKDIISGLDWDGDTILTDQRFNDAPHFQIK